MVVGETSIHQLPGKTINQVFIEADAVAELHACLTSPRGNFFRFRVLQAMEVPLGDVEIEQLKVQSGTNEAQRHLHRLTNFGLVRFQEVDCLKQYTRTALAERAINAVREFERRTTYEAACAVYGASLGPNAIRFFLQIYGNGTKSGQDPSQFRYTLTQLSRLSLFLPRAIERLSVIDKLNEADLVVYGDDNHIYMRPTKARSFYQYLRELYEIVAAGRTQAG